ncbi:MAG: prohibitin family protein [Eubacterium sp.]|jgi:regulator of protease activity HflC (stomatin/prohibitin superfamily)|nr:prohibitin family protein [Eubacterium sp.]
MSEIKFTTDGGSQNQFKKAGKLITAAIIVIFALIVIFNSFNIVNEGFIGVKYRFGKIVNENMEPGLNFHLPFIELISSVDIRNQMYEVTTDAYTSDTQTVNELKLKLTYCYDQSRLSGIIRETGISNIEQRILVPNVAKIAKNEIGKVRAEMLVQSRDEIQSAIQEKLSEALVPHGVVVTQFALENINFDDAFEASIQAKVIAEQDALRMQNKTREREEEAKQVVIKAQADADSVEIAAEAQARAIELLQQQLAANPNYIEYLKINNWNGTLPQVIGDGVNPFVVLEGGTVSNTTSNRQTQSAGA